VRRNMPRDAVAADMAMILPATDPIGGMSDYGGGWEAERYKLRSSGRSEEVGEKCFDWLKALEWQKDKALLT
jgi:hypothetical protein